MLLSGVAKELRTQRWSSVVAYGAVQCRVVQWSTAYSIYIYYILSYCSPVLYGIMYAVM